MQAVVELHAVHPTRVELQVLQIPDTKAYPVAHTQLLLLSTMNWVESQVVHTLELEQVRQPSIRLLQLVQVDPTSAYPLMHEQLFPLSSMNSPALHVVHTLELEHTLHPLMTVPQPTQRLCLYAYPDEHTQLPEEFNSLLRVELHTVQTV